MMTEDKYYVDTKLNRQNVQDTKTGLIKCVICPNGKDCQHAHNAIELDLNPLYKKINNLKVACK